MGNEEDNFLGFIVAVMMKLLEKAMSNRRVSVVAAAIIVVISIIFAMARIPDDENLQPDVANNANLPEESNYSLVRRFSVDEIAETIGNAISAFLFSLGFISLNYRLTASPVVENSNTANAEANSQNERISSLAVSASPRDEGFTMVLDRVVDAAETVEESHKNLDDLKESVTSLLSCLPRENMQGRLFLEGDAVAGLLDSTLHLLKSCERICFRPKSFPQALGVLDAARVLLWHLDAALEAKAKTGEQSAETRESIQTIARQLLLSVGKAKGYSKSISSAALILLTSEINLNFKSLPMFDDEKKRGDGECQQGDDGYFEVVFYDEP